MAQITFARIPLYFVFDAPESVTGQWTDSVIGAPQKYVIGTIGKALEAVPGLKGIGSTLKNKIIIPMLVNPSSMNVSKTSRVVKALTKRGMLYQYWQAEPDTVTFSGMAASTRASMIFAQLDSLTRTMENGTRNRVMMIYKFGGVYYGYLDNFKTGIDAEKPGVFDYSFDFIFADKNHFRVFWYAIKTSTINEALTNPGKFVTEQLRLGVSELKSMSGLSTKV